MEDKFDPIRITDNVGIIKNTGDVYVLDFSRESVVFAENRGFKVDEIDVFPATRIPELFYYAFRKNHRSVSREKVDKFREKWGGVPESVLKRLGQLYAQATMANNVQLDEDAEKNETATVEM